MRGSWGIAAAAVMALPLVLTACGDAGEAQFVGYVEADFVRPAPVASGRLVTLAVKRGNRVAPGDLLFALDDTREAAAVAEAEAALAQASARLADLKLGRRPEEIELIRAQLAQAEARRDLAKLTFERQKTLLDQKVVSVERRDVAEAEYRAARAQVAELQASLKVAELPARADEIAAAAAAEEAARARLAEAQWHLAERKVTAPSLARVEETFFEPGDFVPAAGPVVSLLPLDNVYVKFYVPQDVVAALKTGQAVTIGCDGCAAEVTGSIRFIANEAEFTPPVIYSETTRAKLMFRVEAAVAAGDVLKPGLPVDVKVKRE